MLTNMVLYGNLRMSDLVLEINAVLDFQKLKNRWESTILARTSPAPMIPTATSPLSTASEPPVTSLHLTARISNNLPSLNRFSIN